MEAPDLFLAVLPIALLVYWMTKKDNMPSNRALPLAALVLYGILLLFFPVGPLLVHAAIIEGLLTALTPIAIVLGAILLFKTMEHTGAMATVRQWLNGITSSKVAQLMIVGWRNIIGSELGWSHAILYVPSVIPFVLVSTLSFFIFRTPSSGVREVWGESIGRVLKPIGAFLGALVFVKLLMAGGERSAAAVLGRGLAAGAGDMWQFAAVYLGGLGTFFSGSNTVSNLTFGGIQDATATQLGLSRTTILALQSVGGAMGNMVCIHNIVAVCSILGLRNVEGIILRKTFAPMLLYGAIAGVVSLIF